MRCFVIKSGTCPKTILSVEHYRNDGSCMCDGRPAFEMDGFGIHVFRDGKWVALNKMLTDRFGGMKAIPVDRKAADWSRRYHAYMRGEWPSSVEAVRAEACTMSEDHPGSLIGVSMPGSVEVTAVYYQGFAVIPL